MGILVLIAVVVSTPARTAWCEQRVREVIVETADAAPGKSEASTAPGATTEAGGSATAAGSVGLVAAPSAVLVERQPLPDKRNWVPMITLGAASAMWLGVGIGMTVASSGARDDAHKQSAEILQGVAQCVRPEPSWVGRCEQVQSHASRADTLENVARVAYVISGVLAIGAATYAFWPQSKRSEAVIALPTIHSGGAGFAVMGAW
ncbi:hypothetical protein WME95_03355 [Sorangium sp. So ce327]|uniref:hypothetical protein n=1 Tax=Sorangium sp. So ce327 TaxID=3133301 RepID=UPI003F6154FA